MWIENWSKGAGSTSWINMIGSYSNKNGLILEAALVRAWYLVERSNESLKTKRYWLYTTTCRQALYIQYSLFLGRVHVLKKKFFLSLSDLI